MLRDCDDLYRQNDVLLLSDVFENVRVVFQINYWYFTALGLAWDATLNLTRVKLQRLIDSDMLLTVKRGIRGCVFMISTRYGKANKRYREKYVTTSDQNTVNTSTQTTYTVGLCAIPLSPSHA